MTKKQELFCIEYLKDLNAKQAAIRAGYSENRAGEIGYQLLHKTTINEYISNKLNKRNDKIEISAERVIAELARVAFINPQKFFDENGKLKKITDLDENTARTLAGFEISVGENKEGVSYENVKKIKHLDKVRALELLAKYFKLLTERFETTVTVQQTSFDVSKLTPDDLAQLSNMLKRIQQPVNAEEVGK